MRLKITLNGIKSMLKKVLIVVFYSKVISKTTNLSYMYDINWAGKEFAGCNEI